MTSRRGVRLPAWSGQTPLAVGLLLALLVAACGIGEPPRPAIIEALVAAAPAGSEVTVDHWTPGPFGTGDERWEWVVKAADERVVLAIYNEWFRENGISVTSTAGGGISADAGRLTILPGSDAARDPAVLGTLADDSVLAR